MPKPNTHLIRKFIVVAWALFIFLSSCKEGTPIANKPPETSISVKKINLSGQNRLNSNVQLTWNGTDPDGYVIGYEFNINNGMWYFTEKQDTVFKFSLPPNQDTTDIQFNVRAIDNNSIPDPTPATLILPLKNSPPEIEFIKKSLTEDSALLVYTFQFETMDQDGNESIKNAYIKANNGQWTSIDLNQNMLSLVAQNPNNIGRTKANIYYGTNKQNENIQLDGFINGGNNIFYLKCVDQAGVESKIDTSETVFIRPKTADLLVVGVQPKVVLQSYKTILDASGQNYDLVDYFKEGGQNFPKFWDPSFRLMASYYTKLFFFSDQSTVSNPFNNQTGLALNFAAQALQRYNDNGGKLFITTSFPSIVDFQNLGGPFPIDSVSSQGGQALMSNDSFLISGVSLPSLQTTNVQLGLDPFYPSIDAEVIYSAQLTPLDNWSGPKTIAVRRKRDSQTIQVFFAVELYKYNKDPEALNSLFSTILKDWFR